MTAAEDLRRRARADADAQPEADLSALRTEAERWRDLTLRKRDLEESLREVNIKINDLEFSVLPSLMDEARVSSLSLSAEGNRPGVDLRVSPYYHANIAADWDPARRRAAFDALTKFGHGDLIKTDVAVALPRDDNRSRLDKLLNGLRRAGYEPTVKEAVHFSTLTAFVKEQAEAAAALPPAKALKELARRLPPLEVIGAKIGRICRPKIKD